MSRSEREERKEAKEYFGWILKQSEHIKSIHRELKTCMEIEESVKNKGIGEENYKKVSSLISALEDPKVRVPLKNAVEEEYKFSQKMHRATLLTSDVIESLFGKYKSIAKPRNLSEINRQVLILPCICQQLTPEVVARKFSSTLNRDAENWIKENIGPTLFSKRLKLTKLIKNITEEQNRINAIKCTEQKPGGEEKCDKGRNAAA